MSESLREFAASLGRVSNRALDQVEKAIEDGALNIRNQMRQEASGHPHFRALPRSITHELRTVRSAVEAEIGPRTGILAGIAYFGSSRPGGATVPDPKGALGAEAPAVERRIGDIVGKALET